MSDNTFSPSIGTLGLSVRVRNALERHKKGMTVEDLCAMTERQVRLLRGIDRKRFTEIRVVLAGLDLDFAPEPPPPPVEASPVIMEFIEKTWDAACKRTEAAETAAYALQGMSTQLAGALDTLRDAGRSWRFRALEAEKSLQLKEARIQELRGELAKVPNVERFELLMSLLAQVSIALDEWNADPDSRRAEERLTDRLDEILKGAGRAFDLPDEVKRILEEGA